MSSEANVVTASCKSKVRTRVFDDTLVADDVAVVSEEGYLSITDSAVRLWYFS